jgi:Tol biopolymer transport system component
MLVLTSVSASAAVPATVRVSVSTSGSQVDRATTLAMRGISDDGRDVLMSSTAARMVAGDTNRVSDAFVRDTTANRTLRVSVSSSERRANGASTADAISPDGRFVVFASKATNLSVAADTNRVSDMLVRDRKLGITRRVSIPPSGGQFRGASRGGSISANGRYVVFTELPPRHPLRAYLRDRVRGTTARIGRGAPRGWDVQADGMSANGRMLAYVASDQRDDCGVFIHDRATGKTVNTTTLSATLGTCCDGPAAFTPDGAKAVFGCLAANQTTQVVVLWSRGGSFTQLTNANVGDDSVPTAITDDGSEVSFVSFDPTRVAGDTNGRVDLFSMNLNSHRVSRLDLTSAGGQIPAGIADDPFVWSGGQLSGDGHWAAFGSAGGTVVPGDTNRAVDVFERGPVS